MVVEWGEGPPLTGGPAQAVARLYVCAEIENVYVCREATVQQSVTLQSTAPAIFAPGPTPEWTPSPTPEVAPPIPLATPILVFLGTRPLETDHGPFTIYDLEVANWRDYPHELFAPKRAGTGGNSQVPSDVIHSEEVSKACRRRSRHARVTMHKQGSATVGRTHPHHQPGWGRSLALALVAVLAVGCSAAPADERSPSPEATAPVTTPSPTADSTPSDPASTPAMGSPPPSLSAEPSPTAVTDIWQGPELIPATEVYRSLSLVVDAAGAAHVAADRLGRIIYLTNRDGSWTEQQLSEPDDDPAADADDEWYPLQDYSPSIGLAEDGSPLVTFTRGRESELGGFFDSASYVVNSQSGRWSEPERLAVPGLDSARPTIHGGHFHIAYLPEGPINDIACADAEPLRYATNVSGEWTDELVAARGGWSRLRVGPDERAHLLYVDDGCDDYEQVAPRAIWYGRAADPAGSFALEPLPGVAPYDAPVDLWVDDEGRPHVLLHHDSDDDDTYTYYATRDDQSWTVEVLPVLGAPGRRIAVDKDGALHLLGLGVGGTWYANNRSGEFEFEVLSDEPSWCYGDAALAIDSIGRAHILFAVGDDEGGSCALWYAVGPAQ